MVSVVLLGVGILYAIWDPRRRMLHDIVTGCLVIRSRKEEAVPIENGHGPDGEVADKDRR